MSSSVADLVRKLDKAATEIKGAEKTSVEAATIAAKSTMVAAADSVRTPKTINARRGKKSNAWGVRYLWYTTEKNPRSVVYYWGAPPYWREHGTKAHSIVPTKKKKALLINGLFAASSHVGGVTARPFWTPTKTTIGRQTDPILKATNTAALVRAGFH